VIARENPFRTERLEALPFRFLEGDWARLWARLEAVGGRGALVGPRGSGKTTLLHQMAERLFARGIAPRLLSAPALDDDDLEGEVLLVDGGERLTPGAWRRLLACPAATLVVTQHEPGRLPTLLETRTTPALLGDLVRELVGAAPDLDLPALFAQHRGDLRAALLALYDRWASGGDR
jgi:hypothetical protein